MTRDAARYPQTILDCSGLSFFPGVPRIVPSSLPRLPLTSIARLEIMRVIAVTGRVIISKNIEGRVSETTARPRAVVFRDLFDARPVAQMIGNLTTQVGLHYVGAEPLPLTVNSDPAQPTCYLCCPSVAYIDYARDELRHFSGFELLSRALGAVVSLGYPLIRAARLDRQVQANNWLLATNPLPQIDFAALAATTRELQQMHPGHVVVWRSLNDYSDGEAIRIFREVGYQMFPARQIYLFDCRGTAPKVHRDEQRDKALLEQGAFTAVPPAAFGEDDFARAQVLYRQLYLDKYTWLNPQYTAAFMQAMHAGGILEFHGLSGASGELCGVIGFFDAGRTMTAPIVGYDTTLPQQTGLYRMLMALALRRARERGMLFNMSAGAASFKRNRGGVSALEYSAVYNAGLPAHHRLAALGVRKILEWVGIPVLRSFQL
jgi:hypothetical protein